MPFSRRWAGAVPVAGAERAIAARRPSKATFTRPARSSFTSLETPVKPSVWAQSSSCLRVAWLKSSSAVNDGSRASAFCPTITRI